MNVQDSGFNNLYKHLDVYKKRTDDFLTAVEKAKSGERPRFADITNIQKDIGAINTAKAAERIIYIVNPDAEKPSHAWSERDITELNTKFTKAAEKLLLQEKFEKYGDSGLGWIIAKIATWWEFDSSKVAHIDIEKFKGWVQPRAEPQALKLMPKMGLSAPVEGDVLGKFHGISLRDDLMFGACHVAAKENGYEIFINDNREGKTNKYTLNWNEATGKFDFIDKKNETQSCATGEEFIALTKADLVKENLKGPGDFARIPVKLTEHGQEYLVISKTKEAHPKDFVITSYTEPLRVTVGETKYLNEEEFYAKAATERGVELQEFSSFPSNFDSQPVGSWYVLSADRSPDKPDVTKTLFMRVPKKDDPKQTETININYTFTPETGKSKVDFIQKALPPKSLGTIGDFPNIAAASAALAEKEVGSYAWVSVADSQPKQEYMLIKEPYSIINRNYPIKQLAYNPKAFDAEGLKTDFSDKVMVTASLQEKEIQSKQIVELTRLVGSVKDAVTTKPLESLLEKLGGAGKDKVPFLVKHDLKAKDNVFTILGAPPSSIQDTITVLEGGRIECNGIIYPRFDKYLEERKLNWTLPEAVMRQTFGDIDISDESTVIKKLEGLKEDAMQLWTSAENPKQSNLTVVKKNEKPRTYRCESLIFDKDGNPQVYISEIKDAIPVANLPTLFGATSPLQRKAHQALTSNISPTIPATDQALKNLQSGEGYVLTATDKPNIYTLTTWDKGLALADTAYVGGLFKLASGSVKPVTHEVTVLPNGTVIRKEGVNVARYDDIKKFIDSYPTSIKELNEKAEESAITNEVRTVIRSVIDELTVPNKTALCTNATEARGIIARAKFYGGIDTSKLLLCKEGDFDIHAIGGNEDYTVKVLSKEKVVRTDNKSHKVEEFTSLKKAIPEEKIAKVLTSQVADRDSIPGTIDKGNQNITYESADVVLKQFAAMPSARREVGVHAYAIAIDPISRAERVTLIYYDKDDKTPKQVEITDPKATIASLSDQYKLVQGKTLLSIQPPSEPGAAGRFFSAVTGAVVGKVQASIEQWQRGETPQSVASTTPARAIVVEKPKEQEVPAAGGAKQNTVSTATAGAAVVQAPQGAAAPAPAGGGVAQSTASTATVGAAVQKSEGGGEPVSMSSVGRIPADVLKNLGFGNKNEIKDVMVRLVVALVYMEPLSDKEKLAVAKEVKEKIFDGAITAEKASELLGIKGNDVNKARIEDLGIGDKFPKDAEAVTALKIPKAYNRPSKTALNTFIKELIKIAK